jgi:hypothetical protein
MIRKALSRLVRAFRGTEGLTDDVPQTEAVHLRLISPTGAKGAALYSSPRGELRSPGLEPQP